MAETDEVLDRVETWFGAISEKLGGAAEHAWPAYVEYQAASAWGALILVAAGVLAAVACGIGAAVLYRPDAETHPVPIFLGVLAPLLGLITCGFLACEGAKHIGTVIAPEGYAISRVLELLK